MITKGIIKNPRTRPHLKAAMDYLNKIGATDVVARQKGHLHVSWIYGGLPMRITLSSTPACVEDCTQIAKQLIRRQLRENGVGLTA